MKKLLFTLLLVFVAMTGQTQTKVWNDIVTSFTNASIAKVTQVAFYNDRTELSFHIDYRAGQRIGMNENTYLLADGKQYAIKDATVLKLGEQYTLATDTLDFKLIFEPVPQNVQSVYMVEPNGWQIGNIRSASILPQGIIDTYWRDEATGDWLIGFAKDHVIYQNAVWDIANIKEKKDAYTFTLLISNIPGVRCAFLSKDFSLKAKMVKVSKMKKGLRTITIDDGKPVTCSPITTASLPDYPTKDTRIGFVDNGFRMGDSVTIIGWLKNMPPGLLEQTPEFTVHYDNILIGSQESVYTKLDSLGRFTLKMPLMNTSEVYIDWGRSTVSSVLEPGKTYFLLHDFWTGQKLWMGDDVRVQNELQAQALSRAKNNGAEVPYYEKNIDLMAYWARCDSVRLLQEANLKALQQSHPTLSQRFLDYESGYYRIRQGRNMMQASLCVQNSSVPREYVDYVGENFWKKAPKPYTLHGDFTTLNNNFINQAELNKGSVDIAVVLRRFEKEGKLVLTDEEKTIVARYEKELPQVLANINAAETEEEKQSIADAFNTSETITQFDALLKRNISLLDTFGFLNLMDLVDSLGGDRKLRDIILAQRMIQRIDGTRTPLDSTILAFAEENIQLPAALTPVKALNDKYLAIQQRDISKLPSLKTADDVANMSAGEEILRKLIEPYKGKIILLDVWGTWCSPCKEALSHSQEEYERLKDYDLIFLYLANRSSDESWKSVIKEYEVLGDNVVHFNLPYGQQQAIEHFLNVTGFPTYKLIDRDGTILDVNADPRNLEALARLIEQLK